MEVDDAAWEGVEQELRDERQKACQHDELDVVLLHERQHDVGIVEFRFGDNGCGHAELLGPFQGLCIGLVADDEGHVDGFSSRGNLLAFGGGEVVNQVFAVSAAA